MTSETTKSKMPNLSTTDRAIKILATAVEKAAEKINSSADNAISKISKAAEVASDKLANDALKATDVVANNAATALKVSSVTTGNDHDLLIRLEEGIKVLSQNMIQVKLELKEDIKEIKEGTSVKIENNRVKTDEITLRVTRITTDVDGLKLITSPINSTIVLLEKIASNNQLLIKIGGAWLFLMTSIVVFHLFGIKL